MAHHHIPHLYIHDGDGDRTCNWFIYEIIWDVTAVTNENKKIAPFDGALMKRALTWYMNFTEHETRFKNDIMKRFLRLFKS